MGHERIGFIPKTKQWQSIVAQLQDYDGEKTAVAKIAADTLDALRGLYSSLAYDPAIIASIRYLATVCHFSASPDKLKAVDVETSGDITMYSLLRGANQYLSDESDSMEVGKLAKDSLMNAIISYQQTHETNQISFDGFDEKSIWSDIDSGAAFCEMTRFFVADFTERNLNYFLERAAASEIQDYSRLVSFKQSLKNQAEAITSHSYDISKLVQSFAAGWYYKNTGVQIPDDEKISGFLLVAFRKIKEEFRREGAGQ